MAEIKLCNEFCLNQRNEGDPMTKKGILLIFAVVVISSLAPIAFATCSNCGDATDQDWASSAANFLEGKPINETPSSLSLPQQWRLRNTEFNSSLLSGSSGQTSNQASNPIVSNSPSINPAITPTHTTTPILNIVLNDTHALPNPANFSDPVMITAVFGNNSSGSRINATPNGPSTSTELTIIYAYIMNSTGVEVDRVNLKRTNGNEYAGIWTANVAPGAYKATIYAFGSGASKTFNDALQIEVSASKNRRYP